VADSFTFSCKIPEFLEKSPLSEAGKHPDSQVTSWSGEQETPGTWVMVAPNPKFFLKKIFLEIF
jgi:hypothetical protein